MTLVQSVSGNPDESGLHRYEIDWYETAEWTRDLLLSMKKYSKLEKKNENKLTQTPKASSVCYQKSRLFSYDFSIPERNKNPTFLHVNVSEFNFDKQALHKLKLLAGDLYDPHKNVISLRKDDEGYSHENNVIILSKILEELLQEAQNKSDKFDDVPLDLRYSDKKLVGAEFPSQWIDSAKAT